MPSAMIGVASKPASLPAAYFQRTSNSSANAVCATPVPNASPRTNGQSSAHDGEISTIERQATANRIVSLKRGIIQFQIIVAGQLDGIKFSGPLLCRRVG